MDYDSLKDYGSGLGTGAVIVMDKSTDVVAAIARFSKVRLNIGFFFQTSTDVASVLRPRILWPVHAVQRRHYLGHQVDGSYG